MKLSEICEAQSGYTARSRLEPTVKGGMPAVQLRDLQGEDDLDPAGVPHYDLGSSYERYLAAPGDVLFRSRGERNTALCVSPGATESVVAILPLIILRPDPALVDGRYLAWFINQAVAQRYFDECAQGQSLRMIPKSCLDSLPVPVPDLATQRRITEIDRLARREHALMAQLARKKQDFTSFVLLQQVRDAQPHCSEAGRSSARRTDPPPGKGNRTNR